MKYCTYTRGLLHKKWFEKVPVYNMFVPMIQEKDSFDELNAFGQYRPSTVISRLKTSPLTTFT